MIDIEQAEIIKVMQDAIYTILITSLPMVGIGLIIGLIISVLQSATQINEQTLAFVPKIVGILLVLLIFGGFILSNLTEFTGRIFEYINTVVT